MEEKRTVPLPPDPLSARRKRTIAIAAGAVAAVAVGVASVVAVAGGGSPAHKDAVGTVAATGSSAPYATGSGGGYSQQPQFMWSARAGLPAGSPTSTSSSAAAPSSTTAAAPPTSVAAPPPPAKTTAPAPPPKTSAPPPAPTSKAPAPYQISGTVSCLSGNSVEGVWVQAAQGSGYSPWQGIGNGSTSRYWYTLPSTIPFSLHIGCGGTTASWGVAVFTPQTTGPVANFTCHDVSGQAEYGKCDLQ